MNSLIVVLILNGLISAFAQGFGLWLFKNFLEKRLDMLRREFKDEKGFNVRGK